MKLEMLGTLFPSTGHEGYWSFDSIIKDYLLFSVDFDYKTSTQISNKVVSWPKV